jgi:hypothetical protein
LQQCAPEIAVALALSIAASAFLFATLIDGEGAPARPLVAGTQTEKKM